MPPDPTPNPYEAPQTTPPSDPLRVYRWVGMFFLVLSGLIGLASVLMFVAFFKVLLAPRPGQVSTSFISPAVGNLVIASVLFFVGHYFRRKGRRVAEDKV